MIVSKVFVGQSVPLVVGSPLHQNHYPNAYSVYQNVENSCRTGGREGMRRPKKHERTNVWHLLNVIIHVSVFHSEGTCSSTTHTVPESSPRQRQWFVFDPELVLPEYIIFFEYVFQVMK